MAIYVKSRCAWIGVALATAALPICVFAQQADTSPETPSTVTQPEKKKVPKSKEELQEVVVTGSNIRTDVSEVAALPLTIVTADQIANKGPQELSTTLRENPLFSGGTSNGGSGGFFSGSVETVNLLGLGDKYTLVLVDGRRFNAVTPTNIANIPTGAIDHIEILYRWRFVDLWIRRCFRRREHNYATSTMMGWSSQRPTVTAPSGQTSERTRRI